MTKEATKAESKLRNSIVGALKRCFSRCYIHHNVLEAALVSETGPRGGKRYLCSECCQPFSRKEVQVDHIDPVVPTIMQQKDMNWNYFMSRLFCNEDNLQVLCRGCHTRKTNRERKERKKH